MLPLISSVIWRDIYRGGEYFQAQGNVIENLGYQHSFFRFDQKIPNCSQIVLMQGPYDCLVPLVRQLSGKLPGERPMLVYWFQQSLSFPKPTFISELASHTFSDLHQYYGNLGIIGRTVGLLAPQLVKQKGKRLKYLGDIFWLHKNGLLDLLVLSSTYYSNYLERRNISSIVVPRGYHPDYGEVLDTEKDIAAVWMGKLRTRRRRNALNWVRDELKKRSLTMLSFDGENADFIYGKERTEILNRTWFVLNIFFSGPTDELSIRFFVAGASGAVTLTEPGLNEYPLKPGEHIVECPIEEMPTMIEYYIKNASKWKEISAKMLNLMSTQLTLENSIAHILSNAEKTRRKFGNASYS